MMYLAAVVLGAPLLVWILTLVLQRMEERGDIIVTTKSDGLYRSVGNAVLEVQACLQPEKRHVIEVKQKQREKKQEQDNGDT